jgi:glycosidase
MEFHIHRAIRDRLSLNDLLFSYTGNVTFANVAASRRMAKELNDARGTDIDAERTVHAGALFAMGLIDELNHALVAKYRKEIDPKVLAEAVRWFASQAKPEDVERLLLQFTEEFPNTAVYRGEMTAAEWLKGTTDGMPNREAALEELLMLWLANINPAFAPFRELFEDEGLKQKTIYQNVAATFPDYFKTRPPLAPEVGSLLDALRAPMLASPKSLTGQLEFIRERWSKHLGEGLRRVLLAIDILREEDVAIWLRFHPPGPDWHRHGEPKWGMAGFVGDEFIGFDEQFGPKRRYARDYQAPLNEYEAFSSDQAWMPNVVMLAKSTFVWLEQLSKKYQRHIHRLDQIPDEELRLLADRGITALWLIGLWERSTASRMIKRLRGHADAVASAYSLKAYDIAQDLGGYEAYDNLRHRAAAFGIRMASDMVPNHMGIDSDWVIEHPDWFLYRWENPFPSYSFEGPDLSSDSRVEIKIEDHYYDQSDAAVVFRLRHHYDGTTRYVYHGNDGTSFAWNDTAQLDYSQARVREHVIQTIVHVARLSPIIRFDAAMVLAKRHVQRLWFPLPGTGGSIPSRAENAMSQEQFDALMPHEFWREVVDRVAAEVPGTLLLAEAFWLLEGYFVRTLGMHRVYNSAFMNMLRDEENAKYRSYLKKTIEFDPDILKRYVNFMSNPDERTAIDQFGTGDKYFGVSTLLASLPGLPMFGHGQIEGFTERYGMEFKRARMDESPNEELVARHQREIAPLLKQRKLFAESTHFVLYDFWTGHGTVDENVFAYSNRLGDQRAVILYNNSYGTTRGTIHLSAASMDKGSGSLRQTRLYDGLGLSGHDVVVAYRDATSGLEHLRRAVDFDHHGLTLGLRGYQHVVLLGWRELRPSAEYPWDRLCDALHGEGVPSVDAALARLRLRPVHEVLQQAISVENIRAMAAVSKEIAAKAGESAAEAHKPSRDLGESPARTKGLQSGGPRIRDFIEKCQLFFERAVASLPAENRELAAGLAPSRSPGEDFARTYCKNCERMTAAAARLVSLKEKFGEDWPVVARLAPHGDQQWALVMAWIALGSLPWQSKRVAVFDSLQLRQALAEIFSSLGMEGEAMWRAAAKVRVLLLQADAPEGNEFWSDGDVRWLAGVNKSDGVTYVNKELFEELVDLLQLPALLEIAEEDAGALEAVLEVEAAVEQAHEAVLSAVYDLDKYLASEPWVTEEETEHLPG